MGLVEEAVLIGERLVEVDEVVCGEVMSKVAVELVVLLMVKTAFPVNLAVVMVGKAGLVTTVTEEMVEYQAVEAGEEQLPMAVLGKAVLVLEAK